MKFNIFSLIFYLQFVAITISAPLKNHRLQKRAVPLFMSLVPWKAIIKKVITKYGPKAKEVVMQKVLNKQVAKMAAKKPDGKMAKLATKGAAKFDKLADKGIERAAKESSLKSGFAKKVGGSIMKKAALGGAVAGGGAVAANEINDPKQGRVDGQEVNAGDVHDPSSPDATDATEDATVEEDFVQSTKSTSEKPHQKSNEESVTQQSDHLPDDNLENINDIGGSEELLVEKKTGRSETKPSESHNQVDLNRYNLLYKGNDEPSVASAA